MPQNEFNSAQPFPSCTWTPETLVRFIQHLGPEMSRRGVEVFVGTFERANPALIDSVLRDARISQYIRGIGTQWEGQKALPTIHGEFPALRIYQSEQECGDGENDWRHCLHCWDLARLNFENGANAYMYWNVALPEGGEGTWGWKQNSLITVDESAKSFRFNHEYYLMKHFSHFVQPGALRLLTDSRLAESLAFANPDGSVVVVIRHRLNVMRPMNISIGDFRISTLVEGNSFNTLLLKPNHSEG